MRERIARRAVPLRRQQPLLEKGERATRARSAQVADTGDAQTLLHSKRRQTQACAHCLHRAARVVFSNTEVILQSGRSIRILADEDGIHFARRKQARLALTSLRAGYK